MLICWLHNLWQIFKMFFSRFFTKDTKMKLSWYKSKVLCLKDKKETCLPFTMLMKNMAVCYQWILSRILTNEKKTEVGLCVGCVRTARDKRLLLILKNLSWLWRVVEKSQDIYVLAVKMSDINGYWYIPVQSGIWYVSNYCRG